ncbi:MAG: hypothetical protein ACK5KT_08335 [Dysgonomonas sp.]
MAKYSLRLVREIAALVEEDTYTISEICNMMRISRKTFYEWKARIPEFKKAIEQAEEKREENLLFVARNSLKKKLEGYTVVEERITYVPDKNNPERLVIKNKVVKRKYCPADNTAIRQVLEKHEEKQKAIEEEQKLNKKEELPELVIEFNSNKARRNYEYLTRMMKAGVPDAEWKYWSYNPAYMNEEEKETTNSEQVTADNNNRQV